MHHRHSDRVSRTLALGIFLVACGEPSGPTLGVDGDEAVLLEDVSSIQVFPITNWWNLDVSTAPLDPATDALIDFISGRTPANPAATRQVHPDFGPPPYGIPYIAVGGDDPLSRVHWTLYGSQSDDGAPGRDAGYPIPVAARTLANHIEGGAAGGGASGDRHLILIDRDNGRNG